jgi:hypothetical protein
MYNNIMNGEAAKWDVPQGKGMERTEGFDSTNKS